MTPTTAQPLAGRVHRLINRFISFPLSPTRRINMKLQTTSLLTAATACAALAAGSANATVLFSDDFSSLSGGSGWAAASTWSVANNGGTRAIVGDQMVLTKTDTSNSNTFRDLDTAITVAGADFWFVANYTYTGTRAKADTFFGIQFMDGTTTDNFIGANTGATNWRFIQDGTTVDTSPAVPVTSSLAQVVMHFTESKLDMWVDPTDTSSVGALGTAHATYDPAGSIAGVTEWDRIRLLVGHGNSGTGTSEITVDNMIAATTFGEAVPEPGSLALLGLGGLLVASRRRRD